MTSSDKPSHSRSRPRSHSYDDYVAAHEAAAHSYCPESYRLSFLNTPTSHKAQKNMRKGTALHEKWTHTTSHSHRNKAFFLMMLVCILILLALLFGGLPHE